MRYGFGVASLPGSGAVSGGSWRSWSRASARAARTGFAASLLPAAPPAWHRGRHRASPFVRSPLSRSAATAKASSEAERARAQLLALARGPGAAASDVFPCARSTAASLLGALPSHAEPTASAGRHARLFFSLFERALADRLRCRRTCYSTRDILGQTSTSFLLTSSSAAWRAAVQAATGLSCASQTSSSQERARSARVRPNSRTRCERSAHPAVRHYQRGRAPAPPPSATTGEKEPQVATTRPVSERAHSSLSLALSLSLSVCCP